VTLPRIDIDLACRSCGYDLRGIAADARCPECGRPALESVLESADPTAASLPPIDRPALAGASLSTLVASIGVGSILIPVGAVVPDALAGALARNAAIGCSCVALLAAVALARRFGSRGRRARRILQLAAAGWCGAMIAMSIWPSLPAGVPLAAGSILIWSLRRPFDELGQRCVRFRRQGASRQRAGTLAMSAAIAGGASLLQPLLDRLAGPRAATWIDGLVLVEWIAGGLTFLGLVYLTANSLVIARSLGQAAIDPERLLVRPARDGDAAG
jgi:hypothetical protein